MTGFSMKRMLNLAQLPIVNVLWTYYHSKARTRFSAFSEVKKAQLMEALDEIF